MQKRSKDEVFLLWITIYISSFQEEHVQSRLALLIIAFRSWTIIHCSWMFNWPTARLCLSRQKCRQGIGSQFTVVPLFKNDSSVHPCLFMHLCTERNSLITLESSLKKDGKHRLLFSRYKGKLWHSKPFFENSLHSPHFFPLIIRARRFSHHAENLTTHRRLEGRSDGRVRCYFLVTCVVY